MADDALVSAAARNLAGWHEGWLRALDIECRSSASLWTCARSGPVIYHDAITLAPGFGASDLGPFVGRRGNSPVSVCDSWAVLDLHSLGFRIYEEGSWFVLRLAPGYGNRTPPGLVLEEMGNARELLEFERASIDGFEGSSLHELGPGGLHAPDALRDERMRVFAGRLGKQIVSVAMAYIDDDTVGVYGVATLPDYRRRGFGEALTRCAAECGDGRPVVLQPSSEAEGVYRRMGFRPFGPFISWLRGGRDYETSG